MTGIAVEAVAMIEAWILVHQLLRDGEAAIEIAGIILIQAVVFRPGTLSQKETAQERPTSVCGHRIISIILIAAANVEDRILQTGNDRICHLMTGCARTIGLLRSIVQHLINPRYITIPGDQLHVPIGVEKVANGTPVLLLRLIQGGTIEVAQHDVHHARIGEIPILRAIRHCDGLISIGILDVIASGHEPCIIVPIEGAIVVGVATEIGGDPVIREKVVALIHVGLEVVIGLECVLLGQRSDGILFQEIVIAGHERRCDGESSCYIL